MYAAAYYNLACSYAQGMGVYNDMKKAEHLLWTVSLQPPMVAEEARHNIGFTKGGADNHQRA